MPRTLILLLTLVALAPMVGARAHDDDDAADPVAAQLARYPALLIRVTADVIEAPAELTAGRYHFIQENHREEVAHFFIIRVPDAVTEAELAAPPPADGDPPWFWDSRFVGTPDRAAPGGGRAEGIVDLDPGRYLVIAPLAPDLAPARFDVASVAGVPGSPAADEPAAAVAAEMREMAFDLPAVVPDGRQLWRVSNAGALPHEVAILPVPAGATAEETAAVLLAVFEGGDPAAVGAAWAGWVPVEAGGVGVSAPGRTVWVALDLAPGTFAAVCFFPGGIGQPHLLDGMIQIFTVA